MSVQIPIFVIPAQAGIQHCTQRRRRIRSQSGFTLIEVIVSLLLVGLVGTFSLFFLADGIEGYFITQKAAESAFKAQIALDRIRMELIDIGTEKSGVASIEAFTPNASIKYKTLNSDLSEGRTGNPYRTLQFGSGNLSLTIEDEDTEDTYTLIDGINDPTLSYTPTSTDLVDNDGKNEIKYITVGFKIGSQPPYEIIVYPRNLVPVP
ncbi:MAG: prepilin-type N-terminal cleavage/methylation domain-containing protein [Desulfobacterales bacterium]|nr:prepilin-type N-terminal cleavage/methylation domain-containing protein [Desulfobacterales bacterium]